MTKQKQPKLTRRQKWIIEKMREHGAIIQEYWDASKEENTWLLEWEKKDETSASGRRLMAATVTEKMRCKLIDLRLIEEVERNPKKTKGGKFITTESVYGLRFNKMRDSGHCECGGKYEHVDLQEGDEGVEDSYQCNECQTWCIVVWHKETQEEIKRSYEL